MKPVTYTETLLSNPKKAIALGIVIAIFVILFFIFKNQIASLFKNIKNASDANTMLSQEIAQTGVSLSYSNAEYTSFANQLYAAMKGSGTNKDTIKAVFNKMNHKADVLKLISAFGTRDGETLGEWLHGEVHWWKPGDIVRDVNNIMISKGIDYNFFSGQKGVWEYNIVDEVNCIFLAKSIDFEF